MDAVDRRICELVQSNGRISNAKVADGVGVSASTAHERVRRLEASGVIAQWRGILAPDRVGAGFCGFVLIDVAYGGEAELCATLIDRPEILELHHISGPHSYLAKIRVADSHAMHRFLQDVLKPLSGVVRTETIVVFETRKETSEVCVARNEER